MAEFIPRVDASHVIRFNWSDVFPLQDKSGLMQWLVRASLREPGGSVGFREAGHGPVAGLPVFAPAFGMPLAFKETGVGRMPSSRCKQCNQPLVEIDHWVSGGGTLHVTEIGG
jgi:hypothetical protein